MIILSLLVLTGVIDLFVLMKLQSAFRMFKLPEHADLADKDLPTVSICISARNETHAMTQCLERVVASEYPKLEVIVLDDGSRDDTVMLIKSFAFAGVRFIEGKPLPEGWLGKNYAQSIMANEASGKYIFFMDVDTLFERHTVARAVGYLLANKARMVSFIPLRNERWETSTLMTTMRHFWTMVRFTRNKPRATSNAYLIDREYLLEQLETDTALPLNMLFETSLARKLASTRGYRLALGNPWLGMRYEKRYSSQIETSIRVLYPQCDMYTLQVAWLVLLLALTLVPYAVAWLEPWAWALIAVQYIIGYYYLSKIWIKYRLAGALLLPLTIAQEIWLFILSVYHYKRGTVTWKGRPITTK